MRAWFFGISICLVLGCPAGKAGILRHGPYDIYYTVFPSTVIPALVAQGHQITRADNKIVINVSLRREEEPTSAELSGTVVNLLEQETELTFIEVRERDAIYYLATHIALPADLLRFNLIVTPDTGEPVNINFMRRYD